MKSEVSLIPAHRIERVIYLIRGQKVMIDKDLAALYGVSTKVLNQAVKRHRDRFPEDFLFQLTAQEAKEWWLGVMGDRLGSQIVTANPPFPWGGAGTQSRRGNGPRCV